MLIFLLRKTIKNKWLMMSLLIGNVLLIGIVACVPLFTNAMMKRMFIKDMEQSQIDYVKYPFIIEIEESLFNKGKTAAYPIYTQTQENTIPRIIETYNLPLIENIESVLIQDCQAKLVDTRGGVTSGENVGLVAYKDIDSHVKLLAGRLPGDTLSDGVVECMITETTHLERGFLLNDIIELKNTYTWESPFVMKVVGIFTNADESDYFWINDPNSVTDKIFISYPLLKEMFIAEGGLQNFQIAVTNQILLDYHQVDVLKLDRLQSVEAALSEEFAQNNTKTKTGASNGNIVFRSSLASVAEGYAAKASKLSITLYILQIPIYVLLGFFIFMVSKKILQLEQNEISVIQSRGAKKSQIVGIYLLQGLMISAVAMVLGIALSMLICKVIGSSNGFLDFVQRSALTVSLTPDIFMYAGAAALFSTLTMVLPVVRFSRISIVDYKSARMRKKAKPFWQRFYIDFLFLAVSVYALYSYNTQYKAFSEKIAAVQTVDPLLYISTSFFIAGAGLMFIRLFPYAIKLLYSVFKNLWPPSLFASLLSIIRSSGEEQFIMIFLVFTLATGVFDAKAARSINVNSEDKTKYLAGAEFVVKEKWYDNTKLDQDGEVIIPDQLVYKEPDFQKYAEIEGLATAAKVTKRQVIGRNAIDGAAVEFMGIDPEDFSKVIWFRDDLLPIHINHYLNVLAKTPEAVLVSSVLKRNFDLEIGQQLTLNDPESGFFEVTIKGFFDYWPGYKVKDVAYDSQNEPYIADQALIVGNNSYFQSLFGVRPYEVWMKMADGEDGGALYEYAEENELLFETFIDTRADLVKSKNDAILQGINGVLTVGFIVTLLICFFGFLIFWILSIRARTLQFGIFRAMGMSIRSVYSILLSEQILISGMAIGMGVAIGEMASRLYVPLIQLSFTASELQIPLKIITEQQDYVNLFVAVGGIMILCLIVLGFILSKTRVSEALKLGED